MAVQTATGQAECPECSASLSLTEVMANEIVQCSDCAAELEVVSIAPIALQVAPQEEEDWGE